MGSYNACLICMHSIHAGENLNHTCLPSMVIATSESLIHPQTE